MKILKRADKNHDGKISFTEFAVYFRATATAVERFRAKNAEKRAELQARQAKNNWELSMVPSKDDLKRAKRIFKMVDDLTPELKGLVWKRDLIKLDKGDVDYQKLSDEVNVGSIP